MGRRIVPRAQSQHLGDFSVRLSGSFTLTPSPSPEGEGWPIEDSCPQTTNRSLIPRLTRLTPMPPAPLPEGEGRTVSCPNHVGHPRHAVIKLFLSGY